LTLSGQTMTKMLADGLTSGSTTLGDAASGVAQVVSDRLSAASHRRRRLHAAPRENITQQLDRLGHNERHMSTHGVDRALEKIMSEHRLTVAQLTKATQILLVKGGHNTSTSKISDLVAEMRKHYRGLTSAEILKEAISELEKHPKLSPQALMDEVAKALHAQARKPKRSSGGSNSGSGGGQNGYIGDLTWTAGGVTYTVGGAGRATGPGGKAAGSTSGSSGGGSTLTIDFATMHVEIDLKDTSGTFTPAQLAALRKQIRVRGGNVQRVLGH
jgi:hypothetical protein